MRSKPPEDKSKQKNKSREEESPSNQVTQPPEEESKKVRFAAQRRVVPIPTLTEGEKADIRYHMQEKYETAKARQEDERRMRKEKKMTKKEAQEEADKGVYGLGEVVHTNEGDEERRAAQAALQRDKKESANIREEAIEWGKDEKFNFTEQFNAIERPKAEARAKQEAKEKAEKIRAKKVEEEKAKKVSETLQVDWSQNDKPVSPLRGQSIVSRPLGTKTYSRRDKAKVVSNPPEGSDHKSKP